MATNPYPKIVDLDDGLSTQGWSWRRQLPERNFWVGTDTAGREWLVKMSGKRNAIREHTFARFAQHVGINAQSSKYIILDRDAPPMQSEGRCWYFHRHQLALWMYPEHADAPCGGECPFTRLGETDWHADWITSGIRNPWDRCLGEILGLLCAQFEPCGQLITTDHWWVQIDNELMFGGWPYERGARSEYALRYIRGADAHNFPGARATILNFLQRISAVVDTDIEGFLHTPEGYSGTSAASEFKKWYRQARGTAQSLLDGGF